MFRIFRILLCLNAKGARFGDSFAVSMDGEFVLIIQDKQSKEAKEQALKKKKGEVRQMTLKEVRDEHDKCKVVTSHLFVVITDKTFDDVDELGGDEIVISLSNLCPLLGPLLSALRKYNHINTWQPAPSLMSVSKKRKVTGPPETRPERTKFRKRTRR